MKKQWYSTRHSIFLILTYGLFMTGWNLDYSSASFGEAINIFTGRQILAENFDLDSLLNTGSPFVYPPLAAAGDAAGGLIGARAIGIPFGLLLTWIIYRTGWLLFSKKQGILSAIVFLFTGTAVFFSKSATGDIVAAAFLGLSFYLLLLSEKNQSGMFLLAGASALFLAFVTKYVVIIYVVSFIVFVLWRVSFSRAVLFFLLPLSGFLSAYSLLILHPSLHDIIESYLMTYQQTPLGVADITNWKLQWIELPYLLAVFGMFHKEKKGEGIMLTLLSAPIFLLYVLNGTEQSIEKNMIFALVFLAHAAALGVDQMGNLFSYNVTTSWVKPFFTVAVLAVIWVFGVKQTAWFEQQYPDITPVVEFLKQKGHDHMTLAIDSDDRYQTYVYRYSLEKTFPSVRVIPILRDDNRNREEIMHLTSPDFLLCNGYNMKTDAHKDPVCSYEQGFSLANEFRLPFWSGIQNVNILLKEVGHEV
jgi:4-amino-4-deoxy-L-arabinose transferase-like glycosyltransferase